MTYFSLIFSIVFISAGGYLAYDHINTFKQKEKLRVEAIELNNKYVKEPVPGTLAQSISIVHNPETIEATSELTLINDTKKAINKLILSLNDGLKINSLKLNGNETPFLREKHLIIISENVKMEPGDEAKVEISYNGKIDEALCYLDIEESTIQEKYGKMVINVDKRYAFITPDYLLLTPEANWYPKAGVTYSSEDVGWYQPQFINFSLEVKTQPGLVAVSQGKINEVSAGQFKFENDHPLTQITLAVGNYKQKTLAGKDVKFGIWYLDGHDFFTNSITEINDTISGILSERFEDFERTYNLNYSFSRFSLVEVPAQFKSYQRSWKSSQEYVQPEQVLIPEKGFMINAVDFESQKKNMQRWSHGDNNMSPFDMELRVFEEFLRTFTNEQERNFNRGPGGMNATTSLNPYFIFPMLYNFQNNIQSDKWPITNRIFEAYLKNQVTDMRSVFMSNMQGQSLDEKANIALQDSTFEEILANPKEKSIIDNVIKLKGDVLFSMIEWKAGQEEFQDFLRKTLTEYMFKNIPFEDFDQKINERFGIQLIPMMDDWFKAKTLPGYLFSPITAVKVKSTDRMQTMVKLKVTNFSNTDGLVKLTFRLGGGGGPGRGGPGGGDDMINKLVYLDSHQTKDLSYLLDVDPRMIILNTMTSQNIPQTMMQFFRDIEEDTKAVPVNGEKISETPVQMTLPNEVIVDNEDPDFTITKNENESLLEKWILTDKVNTSKYSGMDYWRPPTNWTAVTNSDFYGQYVRSAYYIKGGVGDLKAQWHVPIKKPGYYDVYFYYYKSRGFGRGRDRGEEKGEYHFTIYGDDGAEESALQNQNAETGWNHLGSYSFSSDTALIELSNKSDLRMVFADAVKLVEL